MSGTVWTKFFWSDWQADPALRLCSYAARGLWLDMLCIAASHDPIGYVAVAGRGLGVTDIARMTGGTETEVSALLGELDQNGVFSRDRKGTIYSRRMVRDAKISATARRNGKNGGNPNLSKQRENPPPDNPPDKGSLKPQKPEARSQKPEKKGASASGGLASVPPPSELPDWLPREAWEAFVDSRKAQKAALTPRAVELAIKKLDDLRKSGNDPKSVLERTVLNGWKGLFELPKEQQSTLALAPPDPNARAPCIRQPGESDEHYKVRRYVERKFWLSTDGPSPDDPDCLFPKPVLQEFGFLKVKQCA